MVCICLLLTWSVDIYAGCIRTVPIWGTGSTRGECIDKQELKREAKELELEEERRTLEARRQKLRNKNNAGLVTGEGSSNVILGGLEQILSGKKKDEIKPTISISQHQVRVESLLYTFPAAAQFDTPGMPERPLLGGVAWEYYINRNIGFGVLWQEWSRKGGRSFDSIKNNYYKLPDTTDDTVKIDDISDFQSATYFPGHIDEIKYRHIGLYVSVNAQLGSPEWQGIGRFGFVMTDASVSYKNIDRLNNPYAEQPENTTYSDGMGMMFGLALERLFEGGMGVGGYVRYVSASNDTSNYLEYINLSSAQFGLYFRVMLEPLGLLRGF